MALIGYARVSSIGQDLTVQLDALEAVGCDIVRSEKATGTSMEKRPELAILLDFIRAGDVLVVTRIDRLARSVADLQDIVLKLKAKGAFLRCTEQSVDMSTPAGKAFLDMLGVFAEFETSLRKERQLEGIAKAKTAGIYKGRTASIDETQVKNLRSGGMGATDIARQLGISRASVYRVLSEAA